jgi:hypothetical protein
MNEKELIALYAGRITQARDYLTAIGDGIALDLLGYGPDGVDFVKAHPVVDRDPRDETIRKLREALRYYANATKRIIYCCEPTMAIIEDGAIARAALERKE